MTGKRGFNWQRNRGSLGRSEKPPHIHSTGANILYDFNIIVPDVTGSTIIDQVLDNLTAGVTGLYVNNNRMACKTFGSRRSSTARLILHLGHKLTARRLIVDPMESK